MKKTNAKLALVETREERLKREWEAVRAEQARHSITDCQLDATLGELIDTLDQHFIESTFNFRINLNATEGHWSKHPYVEGFIEKLDPYVRHLEKKLRTVLPGKYTDHPGQPDSDLTELTMDLEKDAYIVGVFMGAKLAGASTERLNLLRKHLVL